MTVDVDVGAVPAGGPPPAYFAGMAGLALRGLTGKAIAEEPVIAPATVARHVAKTCTKPDVSSGARVAAWAADHDDVPGERP